MAVPAIILVLRTASLCSVIKGQKEWLVRAGCTCPLGTSPFSHVSLLLKEYSSCYESCSGLDNFIFVRGGLDGSECDSPLSVNFCDPSLHFTALVRRVGDYSVRPSFVSGLSAASSEHRSFLKRPSLD